MKCLFLHCSDFSFKKDWKSIHVDGAIDGGASDSEAEYANVLAVFIAVESGDDGAKVNRAAKEVRKIARKCGAAAIVINPFAHLSSTLAPPDVAHDLSLSVKNRVQETWDGNVIYSSFGWYKSYCMSVLSHEASQLFREF